MSAPYRVRIFLPSRRYKNGLSKTPMFLTGGEGSHASDGIERAHRYDGPHEAAIAAAQAISDYGGLTMAQIEYAS